MHVLEAKKYFYLNPDVPIVMERQAAKYVEQEDEADSAQPQFLVGAVSSRSMT